MALRKPALNVKDARRLAGVGDDRPLAGNDEIEPQNALVEPLPVPQAVHTVDPAPERADNSALDDVEPDHEEAMDDAAPSALSVPVAPKATIGSDVTKVSPRIVPSLPQSHVKLQIFLSAHPPAPGLSKSYDMLIERYTPAKALQMILRRAMDEYEQRLVDGTYVSSCETYEADPQMQGHAAVQTSRIMAEALVERARRHFDPLGFESSRAFGLKLATAALANFFAEEARYRRRNGSQ